MKKIIIAFLVIILVSLSGCSSSGEKKASALQGTWMEESGNIITFQTDGKGKIGEDNMTYQISEEDKLTITKKDGKLSEYQFQIKNEKLFLSSNDVDETVIYYKS